MVLRQVERKSMENITDNPITELFADAAEIEAETPVQTDAKPEFRIDSEEKANWLLRKIANLEAEESRVKAQADSILRSLKSDREGLMNRFGAELEQWAKAQMEAKGGKTKTIKLLQGNLSFRTVPARLVLADEAAATGHAKAMQGKCAMLNTCFDYEPRFVTANYWEAAQEYLESTGELLPGIERREAKESFSIKFPTSGKKFQEEES